MVALSNDARFVLDWLSKEPTSTYGECCGAALDELLAADLAEIEWRDGWPPDYGRVSLTNKGRAELTAAAEGD